MNGVNDEKETSVYNEAALQIIRLHYLWLKIENATNAGNLMTWHWLLDSVWRELRADVEHLPNANDIIMEHQRLKNKILTNPKDKGKLYEAINERHEFLKLLQDRAGKGAKYEDGTERNFE